MDLDNGIKVIVIHNKPLKYSQLKRLLLIFDEVYTLDPREYEVFLREGSICYSYAIADNRVLISANNGFEILNKFSYLDKPSVGKNAIGGPSIIHNGPNLKYVIPPDILHLFKGTSNKKKADELLAKFDYAINKNHVKIIDPDKDGLNLKSSINLKISYDFDCRDPNFFNILRPIFEHRPFSMPEKMFIPSPPWVTLNVPGVNIFPNTDYKKPYNSSLFDSYAFEHQYFSTIGLILRSLTVAGEYNLNPVFIDKNIFEYYKLKINSINNTNNPELLELWNSFNSGYNLSINQILFNSSMSFLKEDFVSSIPLPQIISYKEQKLDKLFALRKAISKGIQEYQNEEISNENFFEIDYFLKNKLIPEINKYDKKSFELFEKTIKSKSIKLISGLVSSSIGLVNGLDPFSIALLGGVSPFLVEEGLTLSSKLLNQRSKKFYNSFSYFLDLNKHR